MFKVNDKVMHDTFGVGDVIEIKSAALSYPVWVKFDSGIHEFTKDGKYSRTDTLPSLKLVHKTNNIELTESVISNNYTSHINSWGIFRDNPDVQGGVLGRLRDYIEGSDAPFMSEYTQWAHFTPLTRAQVTILGLEP